MLQSCKIVKLSVFLVIISMLLCNHLSGEKVPIYRIRQIEGNSEFLIAEVNSATYKFLHRKVEKNKTYTYSIVAVNNDSREGDPAYVTIR
jgi:hypothetical protein